MNKVLIILLAILVGSPACQTSKIRKQTADELIAGLQQGVLLVRLQTAEGKAEALHQLGKEGEATAVLSRRELFNEQVRKAFQEHYNFSPVYFFFARDSRQVRERRFSDILQDANQQPVKANQVAHKPFLVAEFSEVQAPAVNAGLDALLLLDEQLKQLNMPFPFAVPTHLYPEEEIPVKAVTKLNLKLKEFYAKAVYRNQRRELKRLRNDLSK